MICFFLFPQDGEGFKNKQTNTHTRKLLLVFVIVFVGSGFSLLIKKVLMAVRGCLFHVLTGLYHCQTCMVDAGLQLWYIYVKITIIVFCLFACFNLLICWKMC